MESIGGASLSARNYQSKDLAWGGVTASLYSMLRWTGCHALTSNSTEHIILLTFMLIPGERSVFHMKIDITLSEVLYL